MEALEHARLLRNLKDAGCGPLPTARILALRENGNQREILRILACHRRRLLEKVHAAQKELDCLDYLVFNLQQNNATNQGRQK